MDATDGLFGMHFPLKLEPAIYKFAEYLSSEYNGGYWHFYTLSNGGFYMAPDDDQPFQVSSANGWEGKLSADALGLRFASMPIAICRLQKVTLANCAQGTITGCGSL
jgi:hypothetical protein